ncbi:hypothetical protein [Parasphingorhabdus cellanae]|uniref:Flagellar hook-length control protein FliK n=1 Tax=Parasphingorhabdus cellanae TaxID=2806553 RepID=A0ABX7T3J6_9SPHN|nr:hypothetical protein [Parasphingorhabdus cellanae]QTD56140.1 hypothetical protein J4G78_00590 [Parasphingorhabdus cellanae]
MTINHDPSANRFGPPSPRSSSSQQKASPQNQSQFERSLHQHQDHDARSQNLGKPTVSHNDDGGAEQKKNRASADHQKKGGAEKGRAHDTDAEIFAWSGIAQGSNPFQSGREIAAQSAPAGQIDMEFKAQIDRMAAAIAEQVQRGQQSQFTLQFAGGLPIESAVLARSATGYISIVLIARPGALGANDRKLLRRELKDRLQQHPIKLAEISFAGKSG